MIVAAADRGTITEPSRLAALNRWQRRLAAMPGVQTVIGPGQVSRAVEPLRKTGAALLASNGEAGPLAGLGRLGRNLARAAGGVSLLREGLSQASSGAGLLAEGSGRAATGALAISRRPRHRRRRQPEGGQRPRNLRHRLRKLAGAQSRAALAALLLKLNIPTVASNLRHNALRRSRKTQKSLNQDAKVTLPQLIAPAKAADDQLEDRAPQLQAMTVGQSDAHYAAALEAVRQASAAVSGADPVSGQPYAPEYAGLPTELTELQKRLLTDFEETKQVTAFLASEISNLKKLASVAKRLSEGLEQIQRGGKKLAHGSARLAHAASSLQGGIGRLVTGSAALAGGISRLTGGATALEENLAAGFHRSAPLQSGLRRISVRVLAGNARLQRRLARVRRATPGLFDSGYFVLSALDGASPRLRERAAEAVDLEGGGQAATMLVISRYTFNSPGSIALNKRLEGDAAALGEEAGLATGVAGGAATLNTYSHVTRDRIPYLVAAITLATFLVLVLVLRALPLAAIAVGLNLATVGVAFGILTLLFNVPESWPLGGHTYVDAVGTMMIFGVVFGLSIDYAVFLLVRMRERYDRDGDNAAAVEFGLEKTARVITGAAAIMMAVFIAFAGAPIATVSQLGVGLTVAVLLDATVVRIVLLPALMLLIGERVWWLPRSLERVLPRLNV